MYTNHQSDFHSFCIPIFLINLHLTRCYNALCKNSKRVDLIPNLAHFGKTSKAQNFTKMRCQDASTISTYTEKQFRKKKLSSKKALLLAYVISSLFEMLHYHSRNES